MMSRKKTVSNFTFPKTFLRDLEVMKSDLGTTGVND